MKCAQRSDHIWKPTGRTYRTAHERQCEKCKVVCWIGANAFDVMHALKLNSVMQ